MATEFGFLIERTDEPAPTWIGTSSLDVKKIFNDGDLIWTRDPDLAVRFSRALDAERIARIFWPGIPTKAVEHGWG